MRQIGGFRIVLSRMLPLVFAVAAGIAPPGCAAAHEVRPAYLQIEEDKPGEFNVLFKTPMQGDLRLALLVLFSGKVENMTPMVSRPTGSAMVQTWRMRAVEPLAGQSIIIDGLRNTLTDALVRVAFADGNTWVERLTPGSPQAVIPAAQDWWVVAVVYVHHGIEHILFGFDHLLFVTSLMLIVRNWRVLVKTITAFTFAHSITLTLATVGVVTLPPPLVEVMIALSILLVAVEAVRLEWGETSLTARWPWVVAFSFGLLHGFGFAGALVSLGLPRGDIPLALFSFNVGVEIGQLVFIGAIVMITYAIRRIATVPRKATVALSYAVGTVAAFWWLQRLDAMFL